MNAICAGLHKEVEKPESSAHLLLVEDDVALNDQVSKLLSSQGYEITSEFSGQEALKTIQHQSFDLVVLDVDLPQVSGFELLNYIRKDSNVPVIMLTAYGAEEHRIRGLKYGADDYISKPCHFTELSLRIEAVLRRVKQLPVNNGSQSRSISYLELELNKIENQVIVTNNGQSQSVGLTPIQFKLLWTLVADHGVVQSKPYLYQAVLEKEFSQYDRSLDMHLSRVRKLLTNAGMEMDRIQTVHGKGYLVK